MSSTNSVAAQRDFPTPNGTGSTASPRTRPLGRSRDGVADASTPKGRQRCRPIDAAPPSREPTTHHVETSETMNAPIPDAGHRNLARLLGDEIRRARVGRRHTRESVAHRLPYRISDDTIATYELGTRQCSVLRLIDICQVLGVSASRLLDNVLRRANPDPRATELTVDLRAVARHGSAVLGPLRGWAAIRLEQNPSQCVVHLSGHAAALAADLCGVRTSVLAEAIRSCQESHLGAAYSKAQHQIPRPHDWTPFLSRANGSSGRARIVVPTELKENR